MEFLLEILGSFITEGISILFGYIIWHVFPYLWKVIKSLLIGITYLPSYLVIFLIRIYQLTLSYFIGRKCRFYPTCSEYTKLAIKKYGLLKGIKLGIKRITRCNRLGGDGVDFP